MKITTIIIVLILNINLYSKTTTINVSGVVPEKEIIEKEETIKIRTIHYGIDKTKEIKTKHITYIIQ